MSWDILLPNDTLPEAREGEIREVYPTTSISVCGITVEKHTAFDTEWQEHNHLRLTPGQSDSFSGYPDECPLCPIP